MMQASWRSSVFRCWALGAPASRFDQWRVFTAWREGSFRWLLVVPVVSDCSEANCYARRISSLMHTVFSSRLVEYLRVDLAACGRL